MKKLNCLLLILTLAACGPAVITTPTVAPSSSSTPAPMATSTAMPTSTSTPQTVLKEQCVEMLPAFPEDSVPSGTLVVYSHSEGLSLLNFRQQTQRTIPGLLDGIGTSPDGKWLSYTAFVTPDDKAIFIESPDGQKKIQLPFDMDWYDYWNPWLGNEWLSYFIWDGSLGLRTVVINPVTGKQQVLLPDYPNFIHYYNGPGDMPLYFGNSNVVYDPSLRFVVYPLETDDGLYAALWDRETNQEIAKVLTEGTMNYPPPLWFPDSRAFVVVAYPDNNDTREWFIVNRDGEIRQLTHFGKTPTQYEFGYISSLSPDGRYLAFDLSHGIKSTNTVSRELFILNLTTLEIFNTCITTFQNFNPIWSPDGRYLAMLSSDSNKQSDSVLVLNIEEGWAANVFEDGDFRQPVGWLDSGE